MTDVAGTFLAHYGVVGMKWGKRKGAANKSGFQKRSKPAADYNVARNLKKNPNKTLSNKELQKVITRKQLEKQYKDLNKEETTIGKGQLVVGSILAVGVTANGLYKLSKSPAVKETIKAGMAIYNKMK